MTTPGPVHDELHGFGLAARRAVVAAQREAHDLGHERVGTEHLLLGLLADPDIGPALRSAGATVAAARRKVREAVPGDGPGRTGDPLPRSARCTRAIGRAVRFARDRRADQVGSDHLLLAVLDVEGTAGQVLRGLGVDIEQLRSSLGAEAPDRSTAPEPAGRAAPPAARCPGCDVDLTTGMTGTRVPVDGEVDVLALSCPACGALLGVVPG